MPSAALDLVAPTFQWMPEFHTTFGPEVADLCESVGFAPDPEQRLALDWTFAVDRSGRSVVRDFGVCAPRQNLKTGYLKMAALGWLYVSELRLVVWSAHEFSTSQEAFRDMCILIENSPDLDREVLRTSRGKTGISRGNGEEAIELRGNRRLKFKARTKDGGRGLTGDRVVLDEAMKLKPDMMAALAPTLRAVPDPQLIYAGSGGLLESEIWRAVRDRGRPGGDPSVGWLEWSDDRPWECGTPDCTHIVGSPACALDDDDRLAAVNTALGRRITLESLHSDRRGAFRAIPRKYATETLGWWEDPPEASQDDALAAWPERANRTATPTAPLHLGIDVAPNMASAAIAVCGSGPLGEVVEITDHGPGTAWVPARLLELRANHGPVSVGIIKGSPAEALVPELGDVVMLTAADTTAACATFARAVTDGTVAHRDDPRLNAAVAGARRKFAGDGWRWSRVASDTDIAPLYAATVARHLWATRDTYDPLANFMP